MLINVSECLSLWEALRANMKKYRLPILLLSFGLLSGALYAGFRGNDLIPILAEDETVIIHLGDKITVDERKLVYNDETKVSKGVIVTPSGGTYGGREFTAKEHGQYQINYEAYFGHHLEKKTVTYLCQRRGTDFFTVNDSASKSYGEFRHNTVKYSHQGVILDVKNGAEIQFTEPIDMNDFLVPQQIDKDDKGNPKTFRDASTGKGANSIIDFIVDPVTRGNFDFTGLKFKLTDTEDSSNYVEIVVKASTFSGSDSGAMSYAKVGFSGGFSGGWEYDWQSKVPGEGKFATTGTGIALSFKGQEHEETLHSAQFLLDYAEKRFYTFPGSLSHNMTFFMNDLDYPDFYKSNGWTGFKNDKCYLSITPFNFSNSKGRLLIKSVGTFDFTNGEMPDNEKPVINVDYKGHQKAKLPKAVLNEYYPIFDSKVIDNYDKDLKATVSVTYRDTINNQDIDVSIKDNKFLANKSGTYYINYTVKDLSGNEAEPVTLRVKTTNAVDDIELELPSLEKSCFVLDPVTFPSIDEITAEGGSGNIQLSYEVIDPQGQTVSVRNNAFTPSLVGDYQIIYRGEDYLGHSGETVFIIHSLDLSKPKFTSSVSVPRALIKGFTYTLDRISAIETIGHVVKDAETEILVNGESCQGSFVADGTEMTIKYCANGFSGVTEETYNVPVIDVSSATYVIDQSKYFYGDFTSTMNKDDVTLSFDDNGSSLFINKLDSSSFLINLEYEEGKDKFTNIEFKFIDVKDFSKTVTMDVDFVGGKLSLPGFDTKLSFAISKTYHQISMSYDDISRQLFDTLGNNVAELIQFDNGQAFTGFNNGLYLEIGVKGVTASSLLKVTKLNNQSLGFKEGSGDDVKPTIRLNETFMRTQFIGEEFFYPSYDAYDVLSEIDSSEVTITRPGASALHGDKEHQIKFAIGSFGQYRVTYQASDTVGNTLSISNSVFVYDDVDPILSVAEMKKTQYKLGDAVSIPKYTVSDNSGKYYVDVILVTPSNEARILTHDENGEVTYALTNTNYYNPSFIVNETSFRPETKGRYHLRFVAYDDEFNKTVVEYTFYVS